MAHITIKRITNAKLLELVCAIAIFTITMTLFYYKYLFQFHGYTGFLNYVTPLSVRDLSWPIFFDAYRYNTVLNTTPESTFFQGLAVNIPWFLMNYFVSSAYTIRSYVVIACVFYMVAAYFLAGEFTTKFIVKVVSSSFVMLNPFMIMLLASGDSLGIVTQALVLFSLFFLIRAINSKTKPPNINWVISIVLLTSSIMGYQTFFLGTGLYLITMTFFSFEFRFSHKFVANLKTFLSYLVPSMFVLLLLILPDTYPLYYGGLTTQYIFSPRLESLISNSQPPLNLLILRAYPPNIAWTSAASFGPAISSSWSILEVLLIVLLLASPLITKKLEYLFITVSICTFAFIGAGADSFFFPLSSFLYLHFPGYESLNGSYFWDWFLSVLYFYLLLSFLDWLRSNLHGSIHSLNSTVTVLDTHSLRTGNVLYSVAVLLIVVMLAIPIIAQGYNNPQNGINNNWANTMPSSYSSIGPELQRLINNSSAGVAYFNPDIALYFNNTSEHFINPLLTFPVVRSAELTYYGSPHTASNRFFYWVYSEFYQNRTRYIGALMGIAGIKFFVVLNQTNSWSYGQGLISVANGKNANMLMSYQYGISRVMAGHGYCIYRNLNYTGTAVSVSNLSLVSGGIAELNDMAYYGWNISSSAVLFSSDLTISDYSSLLSKVSYIVVPNINSLWGIALRGIGVPIQLPNYASSDSPSNGWTSTYNIPQSPHYLTENVNPAAIAYGHATMTVPLNVPVRGNYTIWFQLYHSSLTNYPGGTLNVSAGSTTVTLGTTTPVDGTTNLFVWQKVDANLSTKDSITFSSVSGWNALREAIIVPDRESSIAMNLLDNAIMSHHISVIQISSGRILAQEGLGSKAKTQQVSHFDSNRFADGMSTFLSDLPGYSSSMEYYPISSNGTIYLKLLHWGFSGGLFSISNGNKSITIGFSALDYNSQANSTTYQVALPLSNISGPINIKIVSNDFQMYIEGIVFVPTFVVLSNSISLGSAVNLSGFDSVNPNLTREDIVSHSLIRGHDVFISVQIHYNGSEPQYLSIPFASLTYSLPFYYNDTIEENLSITAGFYLYFNSIYLGDTSGQSVYVNAGAFGTNHRVNSLNIGIYEYKKFINESNFTISFQLNLSFYSSQLHYGYVSPNQVYSEQRVTFTSVGYSIVDPGSLMLIRLPYYAQMKISGNGVARYSADSSISQLLITFATDKPSSVHVVVAYAENVMILSFFDASLVVVLLFIGVLRNLRLKHVP